MTALLLEHLKLIVLFLLIGSIVGLSRLSGGKAMPTPGKAVREFRRAASARA